MNKALLFLNGKIPKKNILPISKYQLIICTDGAYNSLKKTNIPIKIVIGDLDSLDSSVPENITLIKIEDQNTTDFDKALQYLVENNFSEVDILGGNGKESDHYLGNLSSALQFKNKIKICFYDKHYKSFFADNSTIIHDILNKKVSLFPFPIAENVKTKGLKYCLFDEVLELGNRIGTRNIAIENSFHLQFSNGNILLFLEI